MPDLEFSDLRVGVLTRSILDFFFFKKKKYLDEGEELSYH